MKDKIVFIILGILVIAITIVITDRFNEPVAQTDTQTFENIVIRGKLTISDRNGNSGIVLENKDGECNIIMATKGCSIMFNAKKENSIVILSSDFNFKDSVGMPKGLTLFTSQDIKGKEKSIIYLSDDEGKQILESNK